MMHWKTVNPLLRENADTPLKMIDKMDLKDHLPKELAQKVHRFLGINITYDGYIVVAMPGIVAIVSRDLKKAWACAIPGEIVDNGVTLDDNGGIYLVTDKYMRKMVWTGQNYLWMKQTVGGKNHILMM